MKIKNVIIATFSVALLASCGGTDMCGCLDTQLEMAKEVKAADGDEAKMKEIQENYKSDMEACDKMGDEMVAEYEALEGDAKEAKQKEMKEEMEACPAYKEMQEEMGM